jgi:hypothetical protein
MKQSNAVIAQPLRKGVSQWRIGILSSVIKGTQPIPKPWCFALTVSRNNTPTKSRRFLISQTEAQVSIKSTEKAEHTYGRTHIMAHPWDILTCENNHPCYVVLRRLTEGDTIRKGDLLALGSAPVLERVDSSIFGLVCPTCTGTIFYNGTIYSGMEQFIVLGVAIFRRSSKTGAALFYNRGRLMGGGYNYCDEVK